MGFRDEAGKRDKFSIIRKDLQSLIKFKNKFSFPIKVVYTFKKNQWFFEESIENSFENVTDTATYNQT